MSVAMMFSWPSCRARDREPISPPTGPEPKDVSGISTAFAAGSTPPETCMINSGCLKPDSRRRSAAWRKQAVEAGAT